MHTRGPFLGPGKSHWPLHQSQGFLVHQRQPEHCIRHRHLDSTHASAAIIATATETKVQRDSRVRAGRMVSFSSFVPDSPIS